MKQRMLALVLVLVLVVGCLAGCGKEEKEGEQRDPGNEQQTQESLNKYAYKAEFFPLSLKEQGVRYINSFCVSGDKLFLLATCFDGKEQLLDEVTGEPYLDENGNQVEVDRDVMRLFSLGLDGTGLVQLDYTAPEPEEGSQGYGYAAGLAAGPDGSVWFYDQLQTYRFDLPENFDSNTDDPYMYYVDDGVTTKCHHYDAQGKLLESVELIVEDGVYLGTVLMAQDGHIYATDWMNIYQFDRSGNASGSISMEYGFNNMQLMQDGSIGLSVWENDTMMLKRLDSETMTLGDGIPLPNTAYSLVQGFGPYEFLYEGNSAIYGLNAAGESERLFSWMDCDVDSNSMNGYQILQDGTVYALEASYDDGDSNYSLVVMKQVDASELPQKQVLTLACMYLDWDVRSEIVAFNKTNADVRITVNDYSDYVEDGDVQSAVQKLNTEILSGIVPDLFYVDTTIPMEVYAAKGLLLDLWPMIDADPELSREDLMLHFFESISIDGKLYRVADSFGIETVVGRSDVVGNASAWNLNELLDVYETMEPGATIFGEMDIKADMLDAIILRSSNDFVDWSNHSCTFNSPEFIELLNFVNSFPAEFDYENYNWEDYKSEGLRMRMRQQLLQRAYVSSFDTVLYQSAMTDNKLSYIGYPTTDGTGSNFNIFGGFSISSTCKNQDAAWSFVRKYLTGEYQTGDYMYQFPTNRHAFEKYVEDYMTPLTEDTLTVDIIEYGIAQPLTAETSASGDSQSQIARGSYWFSDEEIVEYYVLTQEAYDLFMELYERTNSLSTYNEHINSIIREECEAFFAGQKTAEETAGLIQDRATLYVFEQG